MPRGRAMRREWNETAPDRWRRLHRRAYQDAVRQAGKGSVWLVARVWEMQCRGVLHVHPVLGLTTAAQRAGARAYLERLAELAQHCGFGFIERKPKPRPAVNAAAYLSAYFVRGGRAKATLSESARSGQMPRSIVHVSVRLTQATGCTMRLLRFARMVWAVWAVTLPRSELRVADELAFVAWAVLGYRTPSVLPRPLRMPSSYSRAQLVAVVATYWRRGYSAEYVSNKVHRSRREISASMEHVAWTATRARAGGARSRSRRDVGDGRTPSRAPGEAGERRPAYVAAHHCSWELERRPSCCDPCAEARGRRGGAGRLGDVGRVALAEPGARRP